MKIIQSLFLACIILTSVSVAAPAPEISATSQYWHNAVLVITLPSVAKPEEIRIPWTIVKIGESLRYSETKEGIEVMLTVMDISKDSVDINYVISRSNGPEAISRFQLISYAEFKFDKPQTISINKDQAISLMLDSK